jgi:acyl-CoA synthetase (AMP-forming)/AMP-acid ligase II
MSGKGFLLPDAGDAVALFDVDMDLRVTYDELRGRVERRSEELAGFAGQVVMLGGSRTVGTVVDYLALVGVGAAVMLVDPETTEPTLTAWSAAYRPALTLGLASGVAGLGGSGRSLDERGASPEALLLATSGSTGSPRFVRLTRANVASNAQQIVEALAIGAEDRAFGHLPLFYSFGLSILNSHLVAGAMVVLTSRSMLEAAFWEQVSASEATSLSGVPYSFQMFERMRFSDRSLPHLRELTQAGGWMEPDRVLRFHRVMAGRGGRLWVMYGQTEATARISVLDPADLPDHAGSVGRSLPRSRVWTEDGDAEGVGELVVSGPQVMLGYAESVADLSGRDDLGGVLRTGDLGRVDGSGMISIVGRSKRIAKVFGVRVSLDDIERRLSGVGRVVALQDGDGIGLHVEDGPEAPTDARAVERRLGLPPRSVRIIRIDRIPMTPAGKVDRQALTAGRSGG